MDEDTIKQIFFQSDRPRADAILADEVDFIQFARNIEAFVRLQEIRFAKQLEDFVKKKEHQRCVEIVARFDKKIAQELNLLQP